MSKQIDWESLGVMNYLKRVILSYSKFAFYFPTRKIVIFIGLLERFFSSAILKGAERIARQDSEMHERGTRNLR